ncbi:MAG: phage holin family protein [Myxococcota bacterium]|nr:phage holin family protein [Myxococcota bacterium]
MTQQDWRGEALSRAPSPERPLGELFSELAIQTSTLVRQELRLAKAEMSGKASKAGRDGAMIGAGGALIHAGALFVLAALVLGLGTLIPLWVAALVVGLAVAGGGYGVCRVGLRGLKEIDPTPRETLATLEENKLWVKKELAR